MAQRGDVLSHVDAQGVWPNRVVRNFGCALPWWYGDLGNQVESLGGGTPDAIPMYRGLVDNSDKHRHHLMAESAMYQAQTSIGIAMVEVPGFRWRYAWAIITTPPCG